MHATMQCAGDLMNNAHPCKPICTHAPTIAATVITRATFAAVLIQ
jgi:hypothetical protein